MKLRNALALGFLSLATLIAAPAAAQPEDPAPAVPVVSAVPTTPTTPATPLTPAALSGEGSRRKVEADANAIDQGLSPDVLARLTPEQIKEVLIQREDARVKLAKVNHSPSEDGARILIPLAFFFFTFGVVGIALLAQSRKTQKLHETIRAMIEKGMQIAPEMLVPPARLRNDLRRGVVLLSAGLGICAFGLIAKEIADGLWSVGAIPALIGAGYLCVWKLERKALRDEPASSRSVYRSES